MAILQLFSMYLEKTKNNALTLSVKPGDKDVF